jgi:glucoamylase
VETVSVGTLLRIQADSPFLLHWTGDDWQHSTDTRSQGTALGLEFVDIPLPEKQKETIRFTFLWLDENRWEGNDYTVKIEGQNTRERGNTNFLRRGKAHGKPEATVA